MREKVQVYTFLQSLHVWQREKVCVYKVYTFTMLLVLARLTTLQEIREKFTRVERELRALQHEKVQVYTFRGG